jgi:hypothetical protein
LSIRLSTLYGNENCRQTAILAHRRTSPVRSDW